MARISSLDSILASDNLNSSIIELDCFVEELCNYGNELDKLTVPQKLFYFNQKLELEVNNGGFDQYFCNTGSEYANETIESLKSIGANKTADILKRAIDLVLLLIEKMKKEEDIPDDIWDSLDEEFLEYEDDLNTLNIEYVKKNRDFF